MFTGGGWVFFRKDPSKSEVINDKDGDLIAFYRVLQNHFDEFIRQFRWLLPSRRFFHEFKEQLDSSGLTDIQRAARYYYLQRLCFGGKVRGRTFGATPGSKPRINLVRIEEELSEIHLRLCQVMIENLDYLECITKYDRDNSLFYLDPPYYNSPVYKFNFKHDDFILLSEALSSIKGKFILSLNDCNEIRQIFANYYFKPVTLKYTVAREEQKEAKEVLITNFKVA